VILAEEFTKILITHIKKKDPTLTYSQQMYLAKKYILELYLNYIFLGNHSYGVQSASKKYFGIPASDLSVAQSSIIASLPQAPSTYDPYTNRGDLM
jgi:penicillin-binding protein 1A